MHLSRTAALCWLASLVSVAGCRSVLVPDDDDGTSSGGASSTSMHASSAFAVSTTAAATATSSASSTSGAGGTGPVCGDGITQSPEECDDGNLDSNDGCSATCVVECVCPSGACTVDEAVVKDPVTHHCYYTKAQMLPNEVTFAFAQQACASWHGALATLDTQAEIDRVVALGVLFQWADTLVGARDTDGDGLFEWEDGSPFVYVDGQPPWAALEPNGGGCIEVYSNGAFNADPCDGSFGFLCERGPGLDTPP